MNDLLVYLSAIGFFISVFPLHFANYVYVNSAEKYAGLNVTLYSVIRVFNVNTVKNSVNKMQINGKEKQVSPSVVNKNAVKIFNRLCLTKIIQLTDVGMRNQNNGYIALAQSALTQAVYAFVRVNGGRTKLRNYIVLNEEHGDIVYYMKFVGIINLIAVSKIITLLIMEKFNELKKQK